MVSNTPLKIGIMGGIRAGKDTVAQILYIELMRNSPTKESQLMAFGDGIHEVLKLVMPYIYDQGKPRKELQHIGQSFRQIYEDVWIEMLFNSKAYEIATNKGQNIIITDVRQENEAERLKAEGFTLIKVVASKDVRLERAVSSRDNFTPDHFEHETEKTVESLSFDYMINNEGSFADLTVQVRNVVASIREDGGSQ